MNFMRKLIVATKELIIFVLIEFHDDHIVYAYFHSHLVSIGLRSRAIPKVLHGMQ